MRRNIIFFLFCIGVLILQTNRSFAQMQSYMTYSAERLLNNTLLVYINPNIETVKVEKLSNDTIITLCRDKNTDLSYFLLTVSSNTFTYFHEVDPNYIVYDFKLLGNNIYFCGKVLNQNNFSYTGFIARSDIQTFFFATYPYNIFYSNTIDPTDVVYDMEVYKDPHTTYPRISALGYNNTNNKYYFFDFDITLGTGPYYVFETSFILQDITQTENYISVIFSTDYPQGEFGVMQHKKSNIFDCQSQIFDFIYDGIESMGLMRRPENQLKCYLSEGIDRTDEIIVATTMESNKLLSPYEKYDRTINVYHILLDNISLLQTQLLPLSGKPYIKDMVYRPQDSTLYIVSNISLCKELNDKDIPRIDGILKVKPFASSFYSPEYIVPRMSEVAVEKINNITKYGGGNEYYIVGGVSDNSQANKLYWFDNRVQIVLGGCYNPFKTPVIFAPAVHLGSYIYTPTPIYTSTFAGPNGDVNGIFWSLPCSN